MTDHARGQRPRIPSAPGAMLVLAVVALLARGLGSPRTRAEREVDNPWQDPINVEPHNGQSWRDTLAKCPGQSVAMCKGVRD